MKRKLLAMALLLGVQTVQAASLKVWPVKLTLSPERVTESVKITSESEAPVNLQVSAKSWDIDENGKFIEEDTGDFVFFPRLITVPPHAEKTIRVGYQGDFPELEKPYRLIIQELPPVRTPEEQAQQKSAGVNYVLRLSLPLFVMPDEKRPDPELGLEDVKKTTGGFKVAIKAPGTHHVEIRKVDAELRGASNRKLAEGKLDVHLLRVLPHRRVFVEVPMDNRACSRAKALAVKVYAEGLDEPYEQEVPLGAESCRSAK